jgi:hypothetical protein
MPATTRRSARRLARRRSHWRQTARATTDGRSQGGTTRIRNRRPPSEADAYWTPPTLQCWSSDRPDQSPCSKINWPFRSTMGPDRVGRRSTTDRPQASKAAVMVSAATSRSVFLRAIASAVGCCCRITDDVLWRATRRADNRQNKQRLSTRRGPVHSSRLVIPHAGPLSLVQAAGESSPLGPMIVPFAGGIRSSPSPCEGAPLHRF